MTQSNYFLRVTACSASRVLAIVKGILRGVRTAPPTSPLINSANIRPNANVYTGLPRCHVLSRAYHVLLHVT